jgi:hypothetical protein
VNSPSWRKVGSSNGVADSRCAVEQPRCVRGVLLERSVPLGVPDKVRRRAALAGEAGLAWLADLPQQIADLERGWAITVGQPERRGSEAFVAAARTSAGLGVILKISIPGNDPMRQELRILRAANGIGYAKLIRGAEANNAMLLEKLGLQLHDFRFPGERCIEVICATLREAWIPSLEGPPLVTAADKAVELSGFIESHWSSLGRPCSERTIELALCMRRGGGGRSILCEPWSRMAMPMNGTRCAHKIAPRASNSWILMVPWRNPPSILRFRCANGEMSYQQAIFCSLAATVAICCPSSAVSSISQSGSGR